MVGAMNTAIDFGIFTCLVIFGGGVLLANFISTSCALSFSFLANKNYTFQKNGRTQLKQFALFLLVTLVGLWILQPIVIKVANLLLVDLVHGSTYRALAGKVIATFITLVWNYVGYSRLVFSADKFSSHAK